MWQDIIDVHFSQQPLREKYAFHYGALHRLCTEKVSGLTADYNDFFSRLQAVCRLTDYPLHGIDRFRWRARHIIQDEMEADEATYQSDFVVFLKAYSHFAEKPLPEPLLDVVNDDKKNSQKDDGPKSTDAVQHYTGKALRFSVTKKDEEYIYAESRELPRDGGWKIRFDQNEQTVHAASLLESEMQMNVVNPAVNEENGEIEAEMLIVEPDYLVDVSSLCNSIKEYGDSPLTYLLNKFDDRGKTAAILLGDVANQFLDDCINNPSVQYRTSMVRAFKDNLIAFTTTEGIDQGFSESCKSQFANIRSEVSRYAVDPNIMGANGNVMLEPSFFCETLGLQGRMDFLQSDYKSLIELKSGKWDDFHRCAKDEHLLQMILYKEILFYNLGVRQSSIAGYLLYSKYPYLQEQRTAREMVWRAMKLRNEIVVMERELKDGKGKELLDGLTPEQLNRNNLQSRLWTDYQRLQLKATIDPLQSMDNLTSDYFYTFLQFIEREQYLARVGDGKVESTRGMANLWNAELDTKLANGDILIDLAILSMEEDDGIKSVTLAMSAQTDCQPNFRVGDSVVLYQRNRPDDSAVTKQIIRCQVSDYGNDTITLELRYHQRNKDIFTRESRFAVEHDYIDTSMRALYAGLHSFVRTNPLRRSLLLSQRDAEVDNERQLCGHYLNAQIDDIVLKAKRADDYFLLVGPPGTGKTSVALRSMIEEFLQSGQSLLLLSYTNRAVDEICEVLEGKDYLRLGRELSCPEQYRSHLLPNLVGDNVNRDTVRKIIDEASIVVSTVSSMTGSKAIFRLRQFDVAIFDEASQILEPQLLPLLCAQQSGRPAIGKFVMIGDHKQLPAVVVQDEGKSMVTSPLLQEIGLTNCRNSLFERLYNDAVGKGRDDLYAQLDHQGRMHPEIADFASRQFYDGMLQPVMLNHQREELPYIKYNKEEKFVATTRFGFVDVPLPAVGERQTKMNRKEAETIATIVVQLRDLAKKNDQEFCPERQIGIIVPFRRQIVAVRRALERSAIENAGDMMIDTVERYQGSQRDVIIFGTTISQYYELQILSNIVVQNGTEVDRKLNVAVTRARKQLFVVGNRQLLNGNPLYKELMKYAKIQKCVCLKK